MSSNKKFLEIHTIEEYHIPFAIRLVKVSGTVNIENKIMIKKKSK